MTKRTAKAAEAVDETTEEVTEPNTVSVKEIAERCETDPKSFRRWLRRQTDNRAGKGGRWAFSPEAADKLVEDFKAKDKAEETEPATAE
jgi:isopentenyldiphosphate isomerase